YKIVGHNGQDAHSTLSEGERSFLTFLYFLYELKGSTSESSLNENRIVVFDDPISSLDNEVLYIVSTLIKDVIGKISSDSPIKQVFILTHSMYFFNEVTFGTGKRKGKKLPSKIYWVVTKINEITSIKKYKDNPVKSSYKMLWDEFNSPDRSMLTIRNSMRRILEYYFKTIGGVGLDRLPDGFLGEEKSICRSLISWIHAGSHFTDDDYTVVSNVGTIEAQASVFKRIFENTGHIEHYNMMTDTDSTWG
ncbi:MAG: wobble nucleotide-excising tRNase, partial [Alphaproteobacteria bacterium]